MEKMPPMSVFDAHLHIIDSRYPLVENQGYLPPTFTVDAYRNAMAPYHLVGGAVVSGSFQAFDQTYLVDALEKLGPGFVGVTQVPMTIADAEIMALDRCGVRAVRFNMKRGGSEDIAMLREMAWRVHELAGWHVELYADAAKLEALGELLVSIPAVSIDHLGLTRKGLPFLTRLVAQGVMVKVTGFSRVDFDVAQALRQLYRENPDGLMFGTDLPGTRAPRPYDHTDYQVIVDALGSEGARKVFFENGMRFYRLMEG